MLYLNLSRNHEGGRRGKWSQQLQPSAVRNHDNRKNGIHPGTIMMLVSGNLSFLPYTSNR